MKLPHIALAVLVMIIWGVNFTVVSLGLGSFPPFLLAALRFAVAALPVLIIPRPDVPWPRLIGVASTWFIGQFSFLFLAMAVGMPPGLASVTLQSQVFFTITFAALVYREFPRRHQLAGMGLALVGLLLIGSTIGTHGMTPLGFVLTLAAAACWAAGNVALRGVGRCDMLHLVVWLSLIPPLPLFGLALAVEGPETVMTALSTVSWGGVGAVLYLAVPTTLIGYVIWGYLLKRYPLATVAPFSLLVPLFGTLSAALVIGEQFEVMRLIGIGLLVASLAIVIMPPQLLTRLMPR